jgi:O-antigen ligase
MSRFNNPRTLPSRANGGVTGVAGVPHHRTMDGGFRASTPLPDRTSTISPEAKPNMMQRCCFLAVNAYLLSACANDLIFHFTHGKAHISAVCVILLPLFFLGTGNFLRGWQLPAGIWLTAFAAWLAVATPFSVWRGGSANLLMNYVPRAFLMCFYLAASIVTVRQVRTVVRVMGIGALFVILSCYFFGGWTQGRFSIPDSLFYNNANELALQLLLGIIILMYAFFENNLWAKLVSVGGIFVSLMFMLKTGSRGVLLATVLTGLVIFFTTRRKIVVILVALPALIVAFALAPSEMRHRITLVVIADPAGEDAGSSAFGSQMQRQQLLKTSIWLAITHPLFGVGPGQFAVKVSGDQEKKGEHADWLGTHNSYTQVASEAGLPAFIFYVATIMSCLRTNYWVYLRSRDRAGLETIAGVSFCMFLAIFAYSIAIFFFHEAYSLQLPLMAGVSIALYLTVRPVLNRYADGTI